MPLFKIQRTTFSQYAELLNVFMFRLGEDYISMEIFTRQSIL